MKNNQRPGYLSGHRGLVSRASRQKPRFNSGLGAFGKGVFIPAPVAPPGVPVEGVIDAATGQPYMQDPRCPQGEKVVQVNEPCEGPDCDPGEMEMSEECDDDPNYKMLAPPQPVQPEPVPAADGPTMEQQAELLRLAQEEAATESIVTSAPVLAPPSAYTGSSMPTYAPPLARSKRAQTQEQKLMELVAQYKTEKPVARPAPRPMISTPAPASRVASNASPVPDVFGRFKTALFGSTDGIGGWSDNKLISYGAPLAVLLAVGLLYAKRKK